MKKTILVFPIALLFIVQGLQAQKYFTRAANISFHSDAKVEKIEAKNSSATTVIDLETGAMEFAVLIKGFLFEKALMQEHFNENYMESGKFPKSTFKGKFEGFTAANLAKDGTYPVKVKGQLTIHGVTKDVQTTGQFVVKNGALSGSSTFNVAVADYKIEIPSLVKDNIAKEVNIRVAANYEELKKSAVGSK